MEIKEASILAYTTREVRSYGLHPVHTIYNYKFTRDDNVLVSTGAIKILPLTIYKFTSNVNSILGGKKYTVGEELKVEDFDEEILKMLVRTKMVKIELNDNYKNLDPSELINKFKNIEFVGKKFKDVTDELGLDYEVVKEAFGLKQGGANKKVTEKDLEKLLSL